MQDRAGERTMQSLFLLLFEKKAHSRQHCIKAPAAIVFIKSVFGAMDTAQKKKEGAGTPLTAFGHLGEPWLRIREPTPKRELFTYHLVVIEIPRFQKRDSKRKLQISLWRFAKIIFSNHNLNSGYSCKQIYFLQVLLPNYYSSCVNKW